MYLTLIMMNLFMSLSFLLLNHPMSMGLILLIQTIIIAIMTGMMSYSFWFSYIIFLIMIGGMLILFIYMTSLASNEMFKFSKYILFILIFMFMTTLLIFYNMDYLMINSILKNSNLIENLDNWLFLKNENLITLNKIYNNPNNWMTFILINYLLLTLIAVVKITKINYGPLRQKF
nr:NADH dehydrogenase subunit 6 [Cybister japonicus]